MRTFSLVNADGEKYDLTLKKTSFLHSVEGLGYGSDVSYQRVGNDFAILTDHFEQGEISGVIKFWNPGAQKQYQNFIRFCQNKPLTMIYAPEGTEYKRRGIVTEVEYSEENCLTAEATFMCLTPFYRSIESTTKADNGDENGKIYSYTYPYRYASSTGNSVLIEVDSYIESPCRLSMKGPLNNPSWTHYVNNQEHCTGKLNTTIPEGYTLVIDATQIPYSIEEFNQAGEMVADLYQSSDFGTQRFIILQHGSNRVTVSDDNGNEVDVRIEWMIYYASV